MKTTTRQTKVKEMDRPARTLQASSRSSAGGSWPVYCEVGTGDATLRRYAADRMRHFAAR